MQSDLLRLNDEFALIVNGGLVKAQDVISILSADDLLKRAQEIQQSAERAIEVEVERRAAKRTEALVKKLHHDFSRLEAQRMMHWSQLCKVSTDNACKMAWTVIRELLTDHDHIRTPFDKLIELLGVNSQHGTEQVILFVNPDEQQALCEVINRQPSPSVTGEPHEQIDPIEKIAALNIGMVRADATLPRGSLRLETRTGGVELSLQAVGEALLNQLIGQSEQATKSQQFVHPVGDKLTL